MAEAGLKFTRHTSACSFLPFSCDSHECSDARGFVNFFFFFKALVPFRKTVY